MRVVFSNYDSPANPYYGGGGARAIHEVSRRLAATHEVRIVCGAYPGSRAGAFEGVGYTPMGPAWAGPKLGQLLFQFLLPLRVRRDRFDVWVESLTPPFSTACLQLHTAQPVVALTQVLAGRAMTRKYGLPFGALERLGLRTYRYAIALSDYLAGEVLRANPNALTTVIPNGISPELAARDVLPEKEERHILFLGRLDVRQKGLDLLLEALGRIGTPLPAPVVIAGGGSPRVEAWLRKRIAAGTPPGSVRVTGNVDGRAKHDLLRQALFLVLPSRYEAFPVVLAEACGYQLPVLAFGIPELSGIPETCCARVPPFDVDAFGRLMTELAGDRDRRERMGRAAKVYARSLGWDTLAGRYERFLLSILSAPTTTLSTG